MSSPSRRRDEQGATLILALVFIFAIAMILVAVGGLAANALLNTSNARTQRTAIQDADTAVTIAMDYLRYNYVTPPPTGGATLCLPPPSAPPPATPPSTLSIPSSDPRISAVNPMVVYCLQDVSPTEQPTRVVDFYACPRGTLATACTGVSSAIVHARVAYNDLNPQGLDNCSTTVSTSCGLAMNIELWDVVGADT